MWWAIVIFIVVVGFLLWLSSPPPFPSYPIPSLVEVVLLIEKHGLTPLSAELVCQAPREKVLRCGDVGIYYGKEYEYPDWKDYEKANIRVWIRYHSAPTGLLRLRFLDQALVSIDRSGESVSWNQEDKRSAEWILTKVREDN